ncbi:hypothetical protein [Clostridium botulinum]|uniref:hypothetical protein n=1 Tax=Clostridium botulinum TaxID=1491 RepID=UPI001C9B389C|nr:hypothetical protein [Clostridium botulinum]MBY6838733.1 hypothetical protein [Clostridium botulinum]
MFHDCEKVLNDEDTKMFDEVYESIKNFKSNGKKYSLFYKRVLDNLNMDLLDEETKLYLMYKTLLNLYNEYEEEFELSKEEIKELVKKAKSICSDEYINNIEIKLVRQIRDKLVD